VLRTEVVMCCILNALTLTADLLVNGMCLRCFERFQPVSTLLTHLTLLCMCVCVQIFWSVSLAAELSFFQLIRPYSFCCHTRRFAH